MSFWSGLAKVGLNLLGVGAGAASQSAASNRGTQLQALMDQDAMRLRARDDQRTGETDAMRKLAQTGYIQRGGANFKSTTPYSYSFAPQGSTDAQKQGAATLEQELLKRLQGGAMQLSDYGKQMKPGFWERLGGFVAPIATGISGAMADQDGQRLPGQYD